MQIKGTLLCVFTHDYIKFYEMGTCMAMKVFYILGDFFVTNMHFLILDAHAIK